MKVHVVRQGECLSAIAKQYGFSSYRILYEHPGNAGLREQRPNPNLIYPGDIIIIPDKLSKEIAIPTGAAHHFQAIRYFKVLRVRLKLSTGEPVADHPYQLN